jgi:hypothetical protein
MDGRLPASAAPRPRELMAPEPPKPPSSAAEAAMTAYVGYLAGWFDIGRLAAGRRLSRGGVRDPLLKA